MRGRRALDRHEGLGGDRWRIEVLLLGIRIGREERWLLRREGEVGWMDMSAFPGETAGAEGSVGLWLMSWSYNEIVLPIRAIHLEGRVRRPVDMQAMVSSNCLEDGVVMG